LSEISHREGSVEFGVGVLVGVDWRYDLLNCLSNCGMHAAAACVSRRLSINQLFVCLLVISISNKMYFLVIFYVCVDADV